MYHKVEYQCLECKKMRHLLISDAIDINTFFPEGMDIYLIDVHECKGNKLKAVSLYIDNDFIVRSQYLIEADDDDGKYQNNKNSAPLSNDNVIIPQPIKSDYPKCVITPTFDYGGFNLYGLEIKDKLRHSYYVLEKKREGENIKVTGSSPLNFISITATISPQINKELVTKWLKKAAKIMESVVLLDESTLSFLGSYLDNFITFPPAVRETTELELLFYSPITTVTVSKEKLILFKENWKSIIPELSRASFRAYSMILDECVNSEKTLLKLFFDVGSSYTFPYFLSIVSDLYINGIISLNKLVFHTLNYS